VRHRHAVLGQRAGLVAAQHGGGAQRFDGVDTPRQHAFARQASGPERREDGEHHRVLLGQHGHRQSDARQQRLQPVATQQAVHQHQRQAQGQSQQREVAHQLRGLLLQGRAFGRHTAQSRADASDLAQRPGGGDARQAVALHDQRAGIDRRQVVAARSRGRWRALGCGRAVCFRRSRQLAHRHRLAGEQRFVHAQPVG